MPKHIEAVTFAVEFHNNEAEIKTPTFTINVDLGVYDDPKDAAIDHIMTWFDTIRAEVGEGFVVKFRTFRVLRSRKLADLAWA